jgi:DNA modification methylase
MAARTMGLERVPVHYQDFESDEQEFLFMVADNAIASQAELDLSAIHLDIGEMGPFDIELLGLKDFQFEPDPVTGDPDAVPEVPKVAKTKRGELWLLGDHRLLIDDCTVKENVERLMGGEKADMVFTDPPYGDVDVIDKETGQYRVYNRSKLLGEVKSARNKYEQYGGDGEFSFDKIFEVISSISDRLVVWGGNCFPLPISTCWIVWDKAVSEDNGGNWFSDCELAWTNLKMPILKVRHVLQGYNKESKEDRFHPTQKPVDFIIKTFDRITSAARTKFPTTVMADLFLGSGSTLIACEKTHRRCYGMEIEPLYGDVILTRWAKFTGKDPVREDGVKWNELNG